MSMRFLLIFFLLPGILPGQKAAIFEVFYNYNNLTCQHLDGDTLWHGGNSVLIKRLIPDGKVLETWDANNSPIKGSVLNIATEGNMTALALGSNGAALKTGNVWTYWSAYSILGNGIIIAPARIDQIAIDEKGVLWVSDVANNLIAFYEKGAWKIYENRHADIGPVIRFLKNPITGQLSWINLFNELWSHSNNNWKKLLSGEYRLLDYAFAPNGDIYAVNNSGLIIKFLQNGTGIIEAKLGNGSIGLNFAKLLFTNQDLFILTPEKMFKKGENTMIEVPHPYIAITYTIFPNNIHIDRLSNFWFIPISYPTQAYKSSAGKATRLSLIGISHYPWSAGAQGLSIEPDGKNVWFTNIRELTKHHIEGKNTYIKAPENPRSLQIDPQNGHIWLSTYGRLYRFEQDSFYPMSKAPYTMLTSPYYLSDQIAIDDQHNVLQLVTHNTYSSLLIYHENTQNWSVEIGSNGQIPYKINLQGHYRSPSGKLWMPYQNGICTYASGKWDSLTTANSGSPKKTYDKVIQDMEGRLWAVYKDSLYRYDGQNWDLMKVFNCDLLNIRTIDMMFDKRGRLWITNSCPGISMYDGSSWRSFTPENTNLPQGMSLQKIVEDANGDIWISTDAAVRLRTSLTSTADRANQLSVSPNPVYDAFQVNIPHDGWGTLDLLDLHGRLRQSKSVFYNAGTSVTMSREGLPSGVYIISYRSVRGALYTQKVIFQ